METQKIINLLNDSSNVESKFATKKWYDIKSQTVKIKYVQNNYIKFKKENIKSSLCDYSDAFTLVKRHIAVTVNNNTDVAFKNCSPFSTRQKLMLCLLIKQIIFTLQCLCTIWSNIVIIIQIHHEAYGSLKEMKFQLIIMLIWVLIILNHLNINNSKSFKYKASLVGKTANAVNNTNSSVKDTKIVVPLQYFSNFWR